MTPDLHPNLAELAPLVGRWSGRGAGKYPTITSFEYLEEVTFSHIGKPFLSYTQQTRSVSGDAPMHVEAGYLRVPQPGRVEFVLVHPTGITEIEVGGYTVADGVIELDLDATKIGLTPTAKEVTALGRAFRLEGDELSYTLDMGAVGLPRQNHLTGLLRRTG
ncbi:MAG: peroxynitrite isomerase [Mycobacterium sp.]